APFEFRPPNCAKCSAYRRVMKPPHEKGRPSANDARALAAVRRSGRHNEHPGPHFWRSGPGTLRIAKGIGMSEIITLQQADKSRDDVASRRHNAQVSAINELRRYSRSTCLLSMDI